MRMKLRIMSPAPVTRITASATSAAMSSWPPRRESADPRCRPVRASTDPTCTRDSRMAGHNPKSSAVGTRSASVAARTVTLSVTGELVGIDSGTLATIASSDSHASSTPSAPPISASTALSVSSCRIKRPRPAPIDARTASSDCRAAPRASSKPATLTHAISRISPTEPASTLTVVRE